MNPLMKTLYYSMDSCEQAEAERQASKDAKEAVRATEQHLSYEEFENLWNAISAIERGSELDSFVLGFRLGVQLTLEGIRPIEQPS